MKLSLQFQGVNYVAALGGAEHKVCLLGICTGVSTGNRFVSEKRAVICRTKNEGGKMEQYDNNQFVYAASYALLKQFVCKGIITTQTFEKLNKTMAECQACDVIIPSHWEETEDLA